MPKKGITAQLEAEAKEMQKIQQKKENELDSDRDTDGEEKKADVSIDPLPKIKFNKDFKVPFNMDYMELYFYFSTLRFWIGLENLSTKRSQKKRKRKNDVGL